MTEERIKLCAGVDLAVRRPSALCITRFPIVTYLGFVNDEELINMIRFLEVQVVAIDAPLSLPEGPWRKVDLEAKRRGLKVLPPGWKGMRKLTEKGIRIKRILESYGIEVIETFPSAMRVPLVHAFPEQKDMLDSAKACSTACAYAKGLAKSVRAEDGIIYYA